MVCFFFCVILLQNRTPDTLYSIFVLSGRGTRVRGIESPILCHRHLHPLMFYDMINDIVGTKGCVMMDVKLAFGVRDGKTIHISELTEAERGGNCNCTCPACGEPLIAKMGNKNRHHYAHKTDSTCDIAHANESALHRYAKEIIQSHKRILLPGWEITEDDFLFDCAEINLPSQAPIACSYNCISV